MQEASGLAGRRPAQHQFAGVDLRRPKGYAAPPPPPPPSSAASSQADEAGEASDPCPRCESRDTKFCYYNNYNTAQPRHFCKGCRRYWTKGGTLRNVPVGGGTRKKASLSSSSSSSSYAAAAAKPKRPYKKKRRVAPPEPFSAAPVASPAADPAKAPPTTGSAKTTTTTVTDAASETTTDLAVPAAEDDDSLFHLLQHPDDDAAALELDLQCDLTASGKTALLDPDYSFAWPPPSFDLSTCWGTVVADPDPALLFLNNLP